MHPECVANKFRSTFANLTDIVVIDHRVAYAGDEYIEDGN